MKSNERRLSPDRNAEDAARDTLPPGTTLGHYRIVALLASGGMGDVYRAHDEILERDVALKVLPSSLTHDRDRVQRFAQEAKAASALSHPNIVTIHEIGHARPSRSVRAIARSRERSDVHFIAMELIDGVTLRERLTTLDLPARLELLAQVAEGLGKAHASGIVHRDLKPDNVMVTAEGFAKVVDFGLAKLLEPARGWNPLGADSPTVRAITMQGELVGTAGYMSPEQVTGKAVDQRSDIFSFGCILYEAIGGGRPFEGDSFVDTLHAILHDAPRPLDAASELQRIVGKCLVKDREARYQSIRDVAIDLRNAMRPATKPAAEAAAAPRILKWIVAGAIIGGFFVFLARHATPLPPSSRAAALRPLTSNGRVEFAAVSPDARYIAWVSMDAKASSLWLQQVATGSSILLVPPSPSHYAGLAFSSDANYILFTRYDAPPYAGIFEVPLLGGAPMKLVSDADSNAALAPDGTRFAFVRDDYAKHRSRLIVVNRDGSGERELAAFEMPRRVTSPSWSPDGKQIALARGTEVVAVDVADGKRHVVPMRGWSGSIRCVTWSSDGALVVAAASDRGPTHAQLLRVTASGDVAPITDDFDDYAAVRFAGSEMIALQTKRQSSLWTVDPTGAMQQWTRGIANSDGLGGIAWTPRGDALYVSGAGGGADLWTTSGGEPRQLTRDAAAELQPKVAPDGSAVVYLSRSGDGSAIWRMTPDGTNRRALTHGPRDYELTITPDSKEVVFATIDGDRCVIEAVPIGGGPTRRIATAGMILQYLHVTPDGHDVVFGSEDAGKVGVYRVPLAGGTPRRLMKERSTDASLSPDGKLIACAYAYDNPYVAGLAIFPVEGGEMLKTFDLKGGRYRFTPDGKGVTFLRDGALWLQPLAGGAPRKLTSFPDGSIANYAWSPDGKRVLLTHFVESTDVVMSARGDAP